MQLISEEGKSDVIDCRFGHTMNGIEALDSFIVESPDSCLFTDRVRDFLFVSDISEHLVDLRVGYTDIMFRR